LVEAVPAESEVISRSIANIHLTFKITTWLNAVIALILYFLNFQKKPSERNKRLDGQPFT
ncbi:hypothetical protein KCX74_03585, partial [Virgibacillus salarius]